MRFASEMINIPRDYVYIAIHTVALQDCLNINSKCTFKNLHRFSSITRLFELVGLLKFFWGGNMFILFGKL